MRTTFMSIGLLALILCARAETSRRGPLSEKDIHRTIQRINHRERIETDTLLQALVCNQTALRADAAQLLGETGDVTVVPALIEALSDESFHDGAEYPHAGMATTRWWANESLKKLTHQDFGFRWNAEKAERHAAIDKWKQWLASTR